tara:strand:+ start:341 stop:565 length:225 start_codon:yes stop_codon:yes gene_type:complete
MECGNSTRFPSTCVGDAVGALDGLDVVGRLDGLDVGVEVGDPVGVGVAMESAVLLPGVIELNAAVTCACLIAPA